MTLPHVPRRWLVRAAGAVALTLTTAACDSSPVAASVNGAEIKQTALNRELRLQTANKTYVSAINRAAAANPGSISVTGDAPQTLSTRYVAGVLSTMIQAEAVHQRLVTTGHLPAAGPALAAARAVDEALFATTWLAFPAAFRDSQVAQDAEHAQIEPPPSDLQTLRLAYGSVAKYFFAQVCTRTVAVSVRKSDGTINQAASLGDANQISNGYNLGHSLPALRSTLGTPSGDVACYDGSGLEAQGQPFFDRVLGLAPGQATAPEQTAFGYEVLAVDSRQPLPFDQAAQRALELGIAQAHGAADPALVAVASAAHVTVDPVYGKWDRTTIAVIPSSPLGANSSANS